MNLQEFRALVMAERAQKAEVLRKVNLEKSQAFLATLSKEGK